MTKIIYTASQTLAWLLVLIAFSTALGIAQLPTAAILGTVKDSSGATVPDTAVTVRNVNTGLTRTENSAADGSYRFVALPVGTYEVRAEHTGFRAEVHSSVTLAIGQEALVNFTLEVGAIEQTVEVTAEAPLVNTTSGSLGGLVGEQQVADLPLNGRNYVDLTLLQPGVTQHRQTSFGCARCQSARDGRECPSHLRTGRGAVSTAWEKAIRVTGGGLEPEGKTHRRNPRIEFGLHILTSDF